MSRKATTETDEQQASEAASGSEGTDLHGFWDGPSSDLQELDDALSVVIDDDGDEAGERETLVYMGNVDLTDAGELRVLANWAESKACRGCKREVVANEDPTRLRHAECRNAFRVGRLLRRYS